MAPRVAAEVDPVHRAVPLGASGASVPNLLRDAGLAAAGAALAAASAPAFPVVGPAVAAGAFVLVAGKLREPEDPERAALRRDAARARVLGLAEAVRAARDLDGDGEAAVWRAWLPWSALAEGVEVEVPAEFPHPAHAGFRPTTLAADVGQVGDWVRPVGRGRLHCHEFAGPDGLNAVTVHLDRRDPARGVGVAVAHWLSETPEGLALTVAAAVGAVVLAGWAAS